MKTVMRRPWSNKARLVSLFGVLWIAVFLGGSPFAASDELSEKTRKLIQQQLRALEDCSFDLETTTVVSGFGSPRKIERAERVYYGSPR